MRAGLVRFTFGRHGDIIPHHIHFKFKVENNETKDRFSMAGFFEKSRGDCGAGSAAKSADHYRQHGKHHPAGKIAGHQQKADEQAEDDADEEDEEIEE